MVEHVCAVKRLHYLERSELFEWELHSHVHSGVPDAASVSVLHIAHINLASTAFQPTLCSLFVSLTSSPQTLTFKAL